MGESRISGAADHVPSSWGSTRARTARAVAAAFPHRLAGATRMTSTCGPRRLSACQMSIQVRGPVLRLMMAAAVLVVGCALMPSVATASEAPERWRRAASELPTPAFRPVELAGFRLSRFVAAGRRTSWSRRSTSSAVADTCTSSRAAPLHPRGHGGGPDHEPSRSRRSPGHRPGNATGVRAVSALTGAGPWVVAPAEMSRACRWVANAASDR